MIYFAATLLVVVLLKYLSPVLVYIVLSLFFTILLSPVIYFFQKRGMPALFGYIFSLAIFVVVFGVIFDIVNISAKEFLQNSYIYKEKLIGIVKDLNHILSEYSIKIDISLLENIDILSTVKEVVAKAGAILKGFLVVFIGVSFLLFEQRYFYDKLCLFYPKANLDRFFASTQKYFLIKTFTSFLTGLFVALMLFGFDVPYWAVFGILAFLFNFIPVVGSIIAAIPGILMALITYDVATAFYVTVFYVVINIFISNILEPKLMGEGLDLSGAVVFFSLVLWGWVFGAVGMFLAVPLTMTLKVALESDERTKKWAMLLSK